MSGLTPDIAAQLAEDMKDDGTRLGCLRGWMRIHTTLSGITRGTEGWAYNSIEDLVNKEGTPFTPQPLPKTYRYRKMKECFGNSFLMAMAYPELDYVEGYALSDLGIPMLHAWNVVRETGEVVDATWRWHDGDPKEHLHISGGAMLGLVVPVRLVGLVYSKRDATSVLDDYTHDYPALRRPWNTNVLQVVYAQMPYPVTTRKRRTRTVRVQT